MEAELIRQGAANDRANLSASGTLAGEDDLISPEEWITQYESEIASIPDSNGTRYYQRLACRIGIICDEFFFDSICGAAEFVYLTPDNWEEIVDSPIDVFLFVSPWRGLNNEWRGIGTLRSVVEKTSNLMRDTVLKIFRTCKEKGIPTIFYSKEDPPNYELFLDFARESDYIFTTAAECIPYYLKDCCRETAASVMFGINPEIHNPIGFYQNKKEKTVLFSGSWMKKYPKRCQEISVIFDGILSSSYGLHIIDRNYGVEQYQYPDPYRSLSSPAVAHTKLQKLHKLFDWAVNINSVTASETMFANRTFELQASGVLLFSNYSVGVNIVHPTIFMVNEAEDVEHILSGLTDEERYEHQLMGIRSVMDGHTCYDRIAELLAPTGINACQPVRKILVLCDEISDTVRDSFSRQTYPQKELLKQSDLSQTDLGRFDMVTWFSDVSYYGEFYLEDMINGFKYTACDYITKDAWYEGGHLHPGAEHTYVSTMKSRFRTVFWRESFSPDYFLTPPEAQDLSNGYSIDHCSYFEKCLLPEERREPYPISVIVPVRDKGASLYGKAFSSLQRSSLFDDMEIILLCDDRTDEQTKKVISHLQTAYPNVVPVQLDDDWESFSSFLRSGGAGLASGEYVAFLCAENEGMRDGYAALYRTAEEGNYDVVFGKQYECDLEVQRIPVTLPVLDSAADVLTASGFPLVSIQSMLIRRSFLEGVSADTEQAGADALYCWEILRTAERIQSVDLPVFTAYLYRNRYETEVFKAQCEEMDLTEQWLNRAGLLSAYRQSQSEDGIRNRWFAKFGRAESQGDCFPYLLRAFERYEPLLEDPSPAFCALRFYHRREAFQDMFDLLKTLYPPGGKRPMPTILELAKGKIRKRVFQISVEKSDHFIHMVNQSASGDNATYAWTVLYNENGFYRKWYSSKYSKDNSFDYDCSALPSGSYKIRAFRIDNGGEKLSEDALLFSVGNYGDLTITGQ